jgi:hypothetical protein
LYSIQFSIWFVKIINAAGLIMSRAPPEQKQPDDNGHDDREPQRPFENENHFETDPIVS